MAKFSSLSSKIGWFRLQRKMKVLENDEVQFCYGTFPYKPKVKQNVKKPDILVLDKKQKMCLFIDAVCSFESRIKKKKKRESTTLI